jgi:hypothetical protein
MVETDGARVPAPHRDVAIAREAHRLEPIPHANYQLKPVALLPRSFGLSAVRGGVVECIPITRHPFHFATSAREPTSALSALAYELYDAPYNPLARASFPGGSFA